MRTVSLVILAVLLITVLGCSEEARMRNRLASADPVQRAAAAESLGVWDARESLPGVRTLLTDSVPGVRERAVEAVARLSDAGSDAVAALTSFALNDPDRGVRASAARALCRLDADSAVALVTPILEGPSGTARLRAVQSLTDMVRSGESTLSVGAQAAVGAALADVVRTVQAGRSELPGNWRAWENYHATGAILQDDTLDVVGDQAVITLAWLGSDAAGRGLLDALRGVIPPALQDSVLAVLAYKQDTTIIDAIARGLSTNIVSARRRTVGYLAGIPHERAAAALIGAKADPSREVREAAWRGLARIHGYQVSDDDPIPTRPIESVSEPIQQIARHALESTSPYEAIPAAILLASVENAVAAEHLARFAGDKSVAHEWRIAAYRALEWIPLPESEPRNMAAAIGTGLRDQRDADVRRAAIRTAGRWLAPDRHGEIRRALASDDTLTVRAALIATRYLDETGALAEIGALEYAADILPLFGADSLTRYEAARALAQIGYSDAQTINYLVLTLTHSDANKRHAAVEAIRILARKVIEEGRTAAFATSLDPATKWLTEIARTEDIAWRREHALMTLRYLPSFEADEALGLGSEDPAECVRIVAAEGLAETRGNVALPVIRMIYRDASESGRLRIVDAVGGIGSEKALGLLREISVLDSSAHVRAHARNFLNPSTQRQQPAA